MPPRITPQTADAIVNLMQHDRRVHNLSEQPEAGTAMWAVKGRSPETILDVELTCKTWPTHLTRAITKAAETQRFK